VIPGRYVEVKKDGTQAFPATANASNDGKAQGTITIYNKITPLTPFTLVAGTHFLSDSGKYFVTLAKVVVPAAKYQGSKLVPGQISVKVQAEQSGADYNIGPSKFSAPKLNGTAYYYVIYADSSAAMSGGYTGTAKKISDDDLQSAQDVLSKNLIEAAGNDLKSQIGADEVLADGAETELVVSSSSDMKAGTVTDTFNETASVIVSAIVFKKQDIDSYIKSDIAARIQDNTDYLESSLQTTYNSALADEKAGKLALDITPSVTTYPAVDVNMLSIGLSNKSADQIKESIDQSYQGNASEINIRFWPFWVTKSPSSQKRITISLHF
jgi:hypothetical protein